MHNLSPLERDVIKYLADQLAVDVRSEFHLADIAAYLGIAQEELQTALQGLETQQIIRTSMVAGYNYCVIELLI